MAELEYAKRGLVGVLTPQANTTVEPEFNVLLPAGISMLNARMTSLKKTIEERLIDYIAQVGRVLDQFANAPIQAAAFGCTGASYLIGRKKEAEICDRIEQKRGYPFVTAACAVSDALEALQAEKIGLVSPYSSSLTEISVDYWNSAGLSVTDVASAFNDESDFHPIYSLAADNCLDALNFLEEKSLDAIVMLGTGMPTLQTILNVADWKGPPVTSCMLSLVWRTVLHIDNKEPSTENILTWSRGEDWRGRMLAKSI